MRTNPTVLLRLGIGSLVWLAVSCWQQIVPQSTGWIVVLLLFSPLVLMPLASNLMGDVPRPGRATLELAAAGALVVAFLITSGTAAALCAVPWLIVRAWAAIDVLAEWTQRRPNASRLCVDAARGFPAIGAAWLVANRAGWMPFGFDALIVLLTAAHFHHVGFTLPLIVGLQAREQPSAVATVCCAAILAGVPLVALGITGTHFGVLRWVEPVSVALLASGALGVALLQMSLGLRAIHPPLVRAGFFVSGASLFVAMLLALSFGLRSVFPSLALSMPQMWAVHGTLNTFGFGLCGILSWRAIVARSAKV